jgi:hypothetical protein
MSNYKMVLQAESLGLEWGYDFTSGSDELAVKYAEGHARQVLAEWPRYKWLVVFACDEDHQANYVLARFTVESRAPRIILDQTWRKQA